MLEKHGCADGKLIAHRIMTGVPPPTSEFIANADSTFFMDSIGDLRVPLSSEDPDEQFANGLEGFGSSKTMSFEKVSRESRKGPLPYRRREAEEGYGRHEK